MSSDESGQAIEHVGDVPVCLGCGLAAHVEVHGGICRECFQRRERRLGGGMLRIVVDDHEEYHETPLCPTLREFALKESRAWRYIRDEDVMYADLASEIDKCVRCHAYRTFGFDHYDADDQGVVVGHA
jgi:hypothetical protein